jgi:hypothetical protein
MTDKPLTDFTGTTIECGDTILYAVKESTRCILNLARVAEITTTTPPWEGADVAPKIVAEWLQCSRGYGDRIKGEQVSLTALDNILVIAKAARTAEGESHPEWEACRRG